MKVLFKCKEDNTLMYREVDVVYYDSEDKCMCIGNSGTPENDMCCKMNYAAYTEMLIKATENSVMDLSNTIYLFDFYNSDEEEE